MTDKLTERFFIIDTEHPENIQPGLYGVMFTDDGFLIGPDVPEQQTRIGYYTMVQKTGNAVTVTQDFIGAFGIYFYQNNGRTVLSNSFFRLADYLKGQLTANKEAIRALIASSFAPVSVEDTPAKEIIKLDSQVSVMIDLNSGRVTIEKTPFPYFRRKLDNAESFADLDRWYERWVSLFRSLIIQDYSINSDLSGGFDTRIAFSMLKNAGLELDSIRTLSHEKVTLAKDSDDYRIASEMAADHHFELNRKVDISEKTGKANPEDSFRKCRYVSYAGTITNKYCLTDYSRPAIFIKGLFSSIKGNVWYNSIETARKENIRTFKNICNESGMSLLKRFSELSAQDRYMNGQFRRFLSEPFNDERDIAVLHQKLIVEKLDARKAVDWFMNNQLIVSPFADPDLVQFDYNRADRGDNQFLATLILDRYSPELLKYEIQGRRLDKQTLVLVRELNRKYPHGAKYPKDSVRHEPVTVTSSSLSSAEMGQYLKQIWMSEEFENRLRKYADPKLINYIRKTVKTDKINSGSQPMNALLAVYEFDKLLDR